MIGTFSLNQDDVPLFIYGWYNYIIKQPMELSVIINNIVSFLYFKYYHLSNDILTLYIYWSQAFLALMRSHAVEKLFSLIPLWQNDIGLFYRILWQLLYKIDWLPLFFTRTYSFYRIPHPFYFEIGEKSTFSPVSEVQNFVWI